MDPSEDEAGGGFMQRMMGSWGTSGSRCASSFVTAMLDRLMHDGPRHDVLSAQDMSR